MTVKRTIKKSAVFLCCLTIAVCFILTLAGNMMIADARAGSDSKGDAGVRVIADARTNTDVTANEKVMNITMADARAESEKDTLFKLMIISLIVWIGISVYLIYLNRKILELEKKVNEL